MAMRNDNVDVITRDNIEMEAVENVTNASQYVSAPNILCPATDTEPGAETDSETVKSDSDLFVAPQRKKRKRKSNSPLKPGRSSHGNGEKVCYCSNVVGGAEGICCRKCFEWYHLDCVNLTGLTVEHVKLMTSWLCFRCFNPEYICEIEIPTREAVRKIVREELDGVSQVVEDAVKKALPKASVDACTVEEVTSVVASYAEATQHNQKKAIEEVTVTQKKAIEEISVTQTAQTVAEKVARKIDADNVERDKRRFNVVIMNVPERKGENATQKRIHDLQFCREKLGMKDEDYETCWRAGKLDPKTNLIITDLWWSS